MTNHFVSKRSVFTERKMFYRVTKKSEEDFDQFALRLRHLANIYEFSDIDDQIQHRLVAGNKWKIVKPSVAAQTNWLRIYYW